MEGHFAMDRITWKNKTSLFILIFGHAYFGRELDSVLLFCYCCEYFASVHGAWSSLKFNGGYPKAASLQSDTEKVDPLNILPRCSKVVSKFISGKTEDAQDGMTFSTPSTPGEVQNQFSVITIAFCINTLAGDVTYRQDVSLGPCRCLWLPP